MNPNLNFSAPDIVRATHLNDATVKRPEFSADIVVKEAQMIFQLIWEKLAAVFDAENLRFPKEIIILGGAPGAGKGTHTDFISRTRGLTCPPVVISALLSSPQAQAIKDAGNLVGDREVMELLLHQLLRVEYHDGVVVDGFPRTHIQVECLKMLFEKMQALNRQFGGTELSIYFRRPTVHVMVLYIDEKTSIERQCQRGRDTRAHNEAVQSSGFGQYWEDRPTDHDEELARRRYTVFKEHTWCALQSLKEIFHYHLINAGGPLDEVEQNILRELEYQSTLELDPRTVDRLRDVPVAGQIIIHARQDLVKRLDRYEMEHRERFAEVVAFIGAKILPIVRRHAISGNALVNSEDSTLNDPLALAMLIDVMSERGYHTTIDLHRIEIPEHFDIRTGRIACRTKKVYRIQIRFLGSKIRRGASIDFTWPITKRFGIVIAALAGNTMGEQHFAAKLWQNSGTGTNASTASTSNPFLQSMQFMDGNRYMIRNSLSIKGDWKVGDFSVLSFGAARNTAKTQIGVMINQFSTGTNGSPTVVTGASLSFDPANTLGATGRGSLLKTGRMQSLEQATNTTNLNYIYDDGNLNVDAGFGLSESSARRRYEDLGFFMDVNAVNRDPVRVNFLNIGTDFPATIEVFNNSNQPYDWHTLNNYRPTTSTDTTTLNLADSYVGFVNAKRRLKNFAFPAAVQTGLHYRLQNIDFRQQNRIWDFQGPDGLSPTASAAPYGNQVYVNMDHQFGFRNVDFPSSYRAFQAFKSNPLLYGKSNARLVAEERFRRANSEKFKGKVTAAYIQSEVKLFNSRLNVLGGVRFEHTSNEGLGSLSDPSAVFQRDTAGKFILDGTGKPIRKPAAGAVGSLDELNLILLERAQMSNRTYSGYYPSLHLTYSVKDNLLIRAAYARTYGRPDYVDVLPRTVVTIPSIDEPDPIGNLTVRNPALNPWTADNYDLSIEYYTKDGGVFSAGFFLKELGNFFANSAQVATPQLLSELGLSQDFVGWTVNTKFNSGDARISGVEFDVRQSLKKFGGWARHFTLFANATKLNLQSSAAGAFSTSFSAQGGGTDRPQVFEPPRVLVWELVMGCIWIAVEAGPTEGGRRPTGVGAAVSWAG